nr:hypothetical protein Itr_chr09CG14510 [Ipomoea trifida]
MEDGGEAEKSMEIGKGYASSCTDFLYSSTAVLPSCTHSSPAFWVFFYPLLLHHECTTAANFTL